MRTLPVVFLLALLTACQTMGAIGEDSPYPPPVGSRFTLKQPLTVTADSAHVTLQKGRVVSLRELNLYRPNCSLYLNTVRGTDQTVAPDEFTVKRVNRVTTFVARRAGFVRVRRLADQDSGGPNMLIFRTVLDLESARQPQVRQLVCERWDHPSLGEHVTIREIRQALGDIMTLTLPAAGSRQP